MTAEYCAINRVWCADILSNSVFASYPLKVNIGTDPAEINLSESRHKRNTAAKNDFVADTVSYKVHCITHNLAACFVVKREHTGCIQKIKLNHIIAPFIEDNIEKVSDISRSILIVNIKCIERTPVWSCHIKLAFFVMHKPVFMLFINGRICCCRKRSKPQACQHILFMDFISNFFHTVREFIFLCFKPVADCLLISVINLENINLFIQL